MLGKSTGLFNLSNSDRCVGSFILKDDLLQVLELSESQVSKIPHHIINDQIAYDENHIHKFWYNENPMGYGNKVSFDEFLLHELIKIIYPKATIERQERVKRFKMDLSIELSGSKKYIEFDGPSHFAAGRYGLPKHDPYRKKKIVEDATGCEVINWPYWIQRCESNIKSAIEGNVAGYGVLWSTRCHFGDFIFDNSAQIILDMSRQFNVSEDDGFGNFYGPSTLGRNNPEHPIIQKIIDGKERIERLIPKGAQNRDFWLPERLRSY